MMELLNDIAIKGIFSTTMRENGSCTTGKAEVVLLQFLTRCRGQQSSNKSTKGSVTSMGFAANPKANSSVTNRYRQTCRPRTYQPYAPRVNRKKRVLSRFFRSATHATDSTLSGCSAKRLATSRLLQVAPVARRSSRNKRTALAM